jgi:ATP-dependent protease ClpP protease subunit
MQRFSKAGRLNQKRGFQMNLATDKKSAEIMLYGEIGFDFTARDFTNQLAALGELTQLDIRINSPGGIGSDGIAIYNALVRHPAQKTVYIDAAAYSAASIVAMAASPGQLKMAFNARMMIHNGWAFMMGDKNDLRKEADSLELLDGTIAATYQKRMTDASKDEILALMDEETWFDAEAALEAGLIDEILQGDESASGNEEEFNLVRRFKRAPKEMQNAKCKLQNANSGADDEAARVDVMHRWAQLNAKAA